MSHLVQRLLIPRYLDGRTCVSPGKYIVLSPNGRPIQVNLTDQRAPRRVMTQSKSNGAEKKRVKSSHKPPSPPRES